MTTPVAIRLPVRLPFAAAALSAALCAHAVPGLETADGTRHCRAVSAPGGPALVVFDLGQVTPTGAGAAELTATFHLTDPRDRDHVTAAVRRWLDLDHDPAVVDDALAADPTIGPLVARRPGLRVAGAVDAAECALFTVIGQQVSLVAARTIQARLVATYGTSVALPGGPWTAMPTVESLAAVDVDELRTSLRLTGARARTLHGLAEALAGGLPLDPTDFASTRAALLALPGIGPWTAGYVALRALGDRDAFTAGDAVLRRALQGVGPREAERISQPWRPWRSYALTHLWTEESYSRVTLPTLES
ncbi:DNA-3-methyladenine glycosylase 2 [Calidifontibacter terrae]